MTAAQAKWVERSIIGLCILSIVFIFQPFSMALFSVGCVTVVIGGLAFNLVPFCQPGIPAKSLYKVGLIVLVILGIAAMLGIGTALLYVEYLESTR